jgi:hypothetical protein
MAKENAGGLAIEELQDVSAGSIALGDYIQVWGGDLRIEYQYNRGAGVVLPVYTFTPER